MSVAWTINGATPESLGVELVAVEFATRTAGRMTLERTAEFDSAEVFAHGAAVVLRRNGQRFFQGKVRARPRSADGEREGQLIEASDAWDELEETVYHEAWAVGNGSLNLPRGYLGLDAGGKVQSTGSDIAEAVDYAKSVGVAIEKGTIDPGMTLWPSEIQNVSVAEVIRMSMRMHPDWEVWLDHSFSPARLNARARSGLTTRTFSVAGSGGVEAFQVESLEHRVPKAVKLLYMTATTIDGEVFRDGVEDKYPASHSGEGPGVLTATMDLQGGNMQFQKSRIQTRLLPTSQGTAANWLKKKYPQLAGIPAANFSVTEFTKTLVQDDEALPDPVDPKAPRLKPESEDDLPRELVRGTIEDWMRKKVGRVSIKITLKPEEDATAKEQLLLQHFNAETPALVVTATDAITKIYKGSTQWTAPEDAPSGLAQKIYNAQAATQYAGSLTIVEADVTSLRMQGCKLNLSGGRSAWATMGALIHGVEMDIQSGRMTLEFGPPERLAPQDWLELQRNLRRRRPGWISSGERTSNELGSEDSASSRGDTVAGFDGPETVPLPNGGFPGGGNLNLTVQTLEWDQDGDSLTAIHGSTVYYWRDGLFLGTEDPEDDPEDLLEQTVSHSEFLT